MSSQKYPPVTSETYADLIRRLDAARRMVSGASSLDQIASVARSVAVVEKRFAMYPRHDIGLKLPIPVSDGSVQANVAKKTVQTIQVLISKVIGFDRDGVLGTPEMAKFNEIAVSASEDLFLFSAYADINAVDVVKSKVDDQYSAALSAVDDLGALLAGLGQADPSVNVNAGPIPLGSPHTVAASATPPTPASPSASQRGSSKGGVMGGIRRAAAHAGPVSIGPTPAFAAPSRPPGRFSAPNAKPALFQAPVQYGTGMVQPAPAPPQQYGMYGVNPVNMNMMSGANQAGEYYQGQMYEGVGVGYEQQPQQPLQPPNVNVNVNSVIDQSRVSVLTPTRSRAGANAYELNNQPVGNSGGGGGRAPEPVETIASTKMNTYLLNIDLLKTDFHTPSDFWYRWRKTYRNSVSGHEHIELIGPPSTPESIGLSHQGLEMVIERLRNLHGSSMWENTHRAMYLDDRMSAMKLEAEYEKLMHKQEDLQIYVHNIEHMCSLLSNEETLSGVTPMKKEGKSYKVRKDALDRWSEALSAGFRQILDDRRSHAQFPLFEDLRDAYGRMLAVLRTHPHCLSSVLAAAQPLDADNVVQASAAMFHSRPLHPTEQAKYLRFVEAVLAEQFSLCKQPRDFLRTDNHVTKLLVAYTRRPASKSHLRLILCDILQEWIDSPEALELNPDKIKATRRGATPAELEQICAERAVRLASCCDQILMKILTCLPVLPYGIRWLCKSMVVLAREKFGTVTDLSKHDERVLTGAFLFLRYFGPAIFSPTALDVLPETAQIPNTVKRNLVLIAKIMQALVNDLSFGGKEEFMIPMNMWVQKRKPLVEMYLDEVIDVVDPEEIAYIADKVDIDVDPESDQSDIVTLPINQILSLHRTLEKLRMQERGREKENDVVAVASAAVASTSNANTTPEAWVKCRQSAGPAITRLLQELGEGPQNVARNQNRPFALDIGHVERHGLNDTNTNTNSEAHVDSNTSTNTNTLTGTGVGALGFMQVGDPGLNAFVFLVSQVFTLFEVQMGDIEYDSMSVSVSDIVKSVVDSAIDAIPEDYQYLQFWMECFNAITDIRSRFNDESLLRAIAGVEKTFDTRQHHYLQISEEKSALEEATLKISTEISELEASYKALKAKFNDILKTHLQCSTVPIMARDVSSFRYRLRKIAVRDVVLRGPRGVSKKIMMDSSHAKHYIGIEINGYDTHVTLKIIAPDSADREHELSVEEMLENMVKNDTILLSGHTFDLRRLIAFFVLHMHRKTK